MLGILDSTMNLLENIDSAMLGALGITMNLLENTEDTMNFLGNIDRLQENLWDAQRDFVEHFSLKYPQYPAESMLHHDMTDIASQHQNFQADVHGQTRNQTAEAVEITIDNDVALISGSTFDQARRKKPRRDPDAARENFQAEGHGLTQNQTAQDVEMMIDDDVALISARSFDHAREKKPRRDPDVVRENIITSQATTAPQLPVSSQSIVLPPPPPQPPSPSEAAAFCCPICWDKMREPTSTRCGHIFCKECLRKAMVARKECPTCRTKFRGKSSTFRVFLPEVIV